MADKFTFTPGVSPEGEVSTPAVEEPRRRDDRSFDVSTLAGIQVGLASPEAIRAWSKGEVLKAETINYRTQKPEATGLFCEQIFGPVKDYECHCGKYKKIRYQGITCERCHVEVISKEWRRERMGHIELVAPCSHIWYLKSIPSRMSLVLDIPPKQLEDIIYYAAHVVLSKNGSGKEEDYEADKASGKKYALNYKDYLSEAVAREKFTDCIKNEIIPVLQEEGNEGEILKGEAIIERLGNPNETFDYFTSKSYISRHTGCEFGDGASAIKRLLKEIDLEETFNELQAEMKDEKTTETKRVKLAKRLEVIDAFIKSNQKPEWMVLDVVPVIPPDLRPMLFLDGGRPAASDLNELYRRVIYRNIALRKLIDMSAPEIMLTNAKRMLQEAVDALFENGRRSKPVTGPSGRPLKSLSSGLKGKQGRFRQNLLGKRVDYSGRSVIAVGPDLKMYQCGIPREMAIQLLRPFIDHELIKSGAATSLKAADHIIDRYDPIVFDIVEKIIGDHPVLLNRAPTLHRLSIQAFQPKLVDGRAIRLHPLVCSGFNADFDGDQMAVHVPLGKAAQEEAVNLMLASNNILTPRDGKALVVPSQDMILGNYHLTTEETYSNFIERAEILEKLAERDRACGVDEKEIEGVLKMAEQNRRYAANDAKVFGSIEEVRLAYANDTVSLHNRIAIPAKRLHKKPGEGMIADVEGKYLITSVGKIIFNDVFPDDFRYLNDLPKYDIDSDTFRSWFVTSEEIAKDYDENCFGNPIFQYINGRRALDDENGAFVGGLPLKSATGKKQLGPIIDLLFAKYGTTKTSAVLDKIKDQGFYYSMISSVTVAISDIRDVEGKRDLVAEGQRKVDQIERVFRRGFLSVPERHAQIVKVWSKVTEDVKTLVKNRMEQDIRNPLIIMANSGSRGSADNFKQLIGMKGLVANPKNEEIELPIVSSYLQGMKVSEFFINTHGARKGSADTALKTADSGYLTRRLVDVAQDVIIREEDCHCDRGFVVREIRDRARGEVVRDLRERIIGRFSMHDIVNPETGEVLVPGNTLITEKDADAIVAAGIKEVEIRTIFTCQSKDGVCVHCYGLNMADRQVVKVGEAVGIMAAQSIGEPGTQLTMRVFHTGGMAGNDITQGLPRVQELVEARNPKGLKAKISEIPGTVTKIDTSNDISTITVVNDLVSDGEAGTDVKEYVTDYGAKLRVKVGDKVEPGDKLTEGPIDLKELLKVAGIEKLEVYMIKEIQKVYKSQGIAISDKHLEIIISQMVRKVYITDAGDSELLPGQRVSMRQFIEINGDLLIQGKRPAVCIPLILGITKASLETDSFLSAASFQETTRVLTDAAIKAKKDNLHGLKENVIAGKLIPAGRGVRDPQEEAERLADWSVAKAMQAIKDQYIEDHDRTQSASLSEAE